jgi:hypothetical protein
MARLGMGHVISALACENLFVRRIQERMDVRSLYDSIDNYNNVLLSVIAPRIALAGTRGCNPN